MMTFYSLRVTPKASRNRIVEEIDDKGQPLYRVYITIAPEEGKANKAVLKLMAKHLGVAPSCLEIIKGEKGREKTVSLKT